MYDVDSEYVETIFRTDLDREIGELVVSPTGQHVAFISADKNLLGGNVTSHINKKQLYIYNKGLNTATLVSANRNNEPASYSVESSFAISEYGQYVAFISFADNLVANDKNFHDDVFIKNMVNGQVIRASISSEGDEANASSGYPGSRGSSRGVDMSADGRYIVFTSDATNLVPNDFNDAPDIFLHDRLTRKTDVISANLSGDPANEGSGPVSISNDGRYVAFGSCATDLMVTDDKTPGCGIYVRDRMNQITNGIKLTGGNVGDLAISADGRYVAYQLWTWGNTSNIYVYDTQTATEQQ